MSVCLSVCLSICGSKGVFIRTTVVKVKLLSRIPILCSWLILWTTLEQRKKACMNECDDGSGPNMESIFHYVHKELR